MFKTIIDLGEISAPKRT